MARRQRQMCIRDRQLMADLLLSSAGAPWFQSYLDLSKYSERISEEGWIFGQGIGVGQ